MPPPENRPNFLIVMTDHQRMDTAQPDHPCITPNLTRMTNEGVNFTNVYCPTAHCCPARATFWSGLYPTRHGVWNNVDNDYAINRGPHEHIRLFSEDLRDAGYDLAYVGKWHVSALGTQSPSRYGWRELMHYEDGIQDNHIKWEKIREQADAPGDTEAAIQMPGYNPSVLYGVSDTIEKGDDRFTQRGIEELKNLAQQERPWALYIGLNGPHTPYRVPQRYLDMYNLEDIPLPPSYADEMTDKPEYYQRVRNQIFDQLGERGTKEAIRHFWAYCTLLDDMFGEILETLESTGQAENTVVLYCSDHGDYVGEHGLFHKQVPAFLGAYHVPAIMRWPAGIRNPGRNVDAFISLADFAPSFLDLAGVEVNRYFTGRSFVPFLRDESPDDWREQICTQCEGAEQHFTQRAVIARQWKYVYNGFGKDELYDLVNDPHEIRNLADDPDYDAIKRDLVGRMWRFAYLEQDSLGATQYLMVNTAPWGPKEGLKGEKGRALPHAVPRGKENQPDACDHTH